MSPAREPDSEARPAEGALYRDVGVDHESERDAMGPFLAHIAATADIPDGAGRPACRNGFFANVVRVTDTLGLAICADGVGTKILVAEAMDRYDTIGVDCVAMNVNDLVCIGARPISFVDYIAVTRLDRRVLDELGRGLLEGAKQSGVSIPGGELAQLREMLRGLRDDGPGLDLVGVAVGLVDLDRVQTGQDLRPGDVVIGIRSSGLHSNGFTLARHVFFERAGLSVSDRPEGLERSLGEELLEPTRIYVGHVRDLLDAGIEPRGLAHITGGGFLNLGRFDAPVGFELDTVPEPPAIFRLLQRLGEVADEEMQRVFNMGIGFCVLVRPEDEEPALRTLARRGVFAGRIGTCTDDPERRVLLRQARLVGRGDRFERTDSTE